MIGWGEGWGREGRGRLSGFRFEKLGGYSLESDFLKRYKVLKGVQRKDKILPAGGEVGRFNIVKMSINE